VIARHRDPCGGHEQPGQRTTGAATAGHGHWPSAQCPTEATAQATIAGNPASAPIRHNYATGTTRSVMPKRPGIIARYRNALHNESFAGIVLLIGALLALIWSNSPIRESYFTMAETEVGWEAIHLSLPIAHWASDGLLALFFFVVGLELKQEFTIGSLHDPRKAAVPIIAAVCGMAGPIGVYCLFQIISGSGIYGGWAIPVATDIAFALAVLSIFGRGLPPAARTFLMMLAVADDLGGIIVIAVFFSSGISFLWLAISLAIVAIFGVLVQKRITRWWLLWPLAILAWYAMHRAGVHATIAGVALGMVVPTRQIAGERQPMTKRFADKLDFYSSGFVLPIFSFFAAGVNIVDSGGIGGMMTDSVAAGIYLGLPVGKCIGIFGGVWIMTRLFKLRLGNGIDLADIFPISLVAGIGFTVSLLIAQLSFGAEDPHEAHARVAVIVGSLLAMVLGAIALQIRKNQRLRGPVRRRRGKSTDASDHAPDALERKGRDREQARGGERKPSARTKNDDGKTPGSGTAR